MLPIGARRAPDAQEPRASERETSDETCVTTTRIDALPDQGPRWREADGGPARSVLGHRSNGRQDGSPIGSVPEETRPQFTPGIPGQIHPPVMVRVRQSLPVRTAEQGVAPLFIELS